MLGVPATSPIFARRACHWTMTAITCALLTKMSTILRVARRRRRTASRAIRMPSTPPHRDGEMLPLQMVQITHGTPGVPPGRAAPVVWSRARPHERRGITTKSFGRKAANHHSARSATLSRREPEAQGASSLAGSCACAMCGVERSVCGAGGWGRSVRVGAEWGTRANAEGSWEGPEL